MPKLHSLAALLAASATLCVAAPAVAAPVTVNLRVEGSTQTLFEGPITTDAKTLNKDASGSHPCDGTNGGAHPQPGATMTGAMDDGITRAGLTWDGSWNSGFSDFSIDRIGPDAVPSSFDPYWGYFLNNVASQVGGCQAQVSQGDNVLFAFASFGSKLLLLSGPSRAATGEPFQVTVQENDGNGGASAPAGGAQVGSATTDGSGHAMLSFADPGNHTLKASRSGSIRSNAATVCVYVPGSGDCGTDKPATETPTTTAGTTPSPPTKDTTPPVVRVSSLRARKTYSSGPRVLSGEAHDSGGIAQVFLRLRATNGGDLRSASKCRWFSGKRGAFTHRMVPCAKARFFRIGSNVRWSYLLPSKLGKGSYVLDVKVLDRAYNAGRATVPFKVR
jgi:hypothetical protein